MRFEDGANWCLSGGAIGSDLMWGMTAGTAGHGVVHWSFDNHDSEAPKSEIVILTEAQLAEADPHCELANKSLHRKWPPRSKSTRNLLRRNWFQVGFSEACYAISTFNLKIDPHVLESGPYHRLPLGTELDNIQKDAQVAGGTAWATQMFIDRHNGEACACYVFDQEACAWFEWQGKWVRIYEPPKPKGVWAGIGTRKLNQVGKLAIRVLMDYKQSYHEQKA